MPPRTHKRAAQRNVSRSWTKIADQASRSTFRSSSLLWKNNKTLLPQKFPNVNIMNVVQVCPFRKAVHSTVFTRCNVSGKSIFHSRPQVQFNMSLTPFRACYQLQQVLTQSRSTNNSSESIQYSQHQMSQSCDWKRVTNSQVRSNFAMYFCHWSRSQHKPAWGRNIYFRALKEQH